MSRNGRRNPRSNLGKTLGRRRTAGPRAIRSPRHRKSYRFCQQMKRAVFVEIAGRRDGRTEDRRTEESTVSKSRASRDPPAIKPLPKRCLAFTRRLALKKIPDADVFVEVRPVEPAPLTDQSPMPPFLGRAVKQPRIPRKRHGDRSTVRQFDAQRVVGHNHGHRGSGMSFSR